MLGFPDLIPQSPRLHGSLEMRKEKLGTRNVLKMIELEEDKSEFISPEVWLQILGQFTKPHSHLGKPLTWDMK